MLGKLIGYETKAFGRIMLPLYGATLAFALFTGLSIRFLPSDTLEGLPGALLFMLYGMLIMAIFIMTGVLSVTRFYKNLLGLEGYLMFSLPTNTASLIASKVISVLIWSALSSITALLSIALSVLGGGGIEPFREFFRIFTYPEVLEKLPSAAGFTTMFLLLAVAGAAASIVRIYCRRNDSHVAARIRRPVFRSVRFHLQDLRSKFGTGAVRSAGRDARIPDPADRLLRRADLGPARPQAESGVNRLLSRNR